MLNQISSSFVPADAASVQIAAGKCIAAIERERKQLFEQEVDRVLKSFLRRTWMSPMRFLFRKPKTWTRQEVEALVRKEDDHWAGWRIQGWGTHDRMTMLLLACNECVGGIVYLSAEDAELVNKWKNV